VNGVLLDTNALLFLAFRADKLAERRIARLRGGDRYVSQVCAIEIAIKHGLGRLSLPPSFQTNFANGFAEAISELSAELLEIDMGHIELLSRLPLHHRDPFDRLIIAQALVENLTVVTRDRSFALYPGLPVHEI